MRRTLIVIILLMALSFNMPALVGGTPTVLLASPMAGCTVDFIAASNSPEGAGDDPFFIVAGDFNLDGNADLAVANNGSGSVTILMGNGMGDFSEPATSPEIVGGGPAALAIGDFNQDTKPDLVVANAPMGNVSLLLGNGAGDFTQVTISPASLMAVTQSVVVADFNEDGKLDLALANYSPSINHVRILLGNGLGDFTEAASSPENTGTVPYSIVVDDFNGDDNLDLAVANQNTANVNILLGNGMGDFSETSTSPEGVGFGPTNIAAGDFNEDGKLDLAVSTQLDDKVTILLGTGTGDFNAAPTSPESVGDLPYSVAVADYNGDNHLDLAVANRGTPSNLSLLLGDGTGDFVSAPTSPELTGGRPLSAVAADFNLDERPDLATANNATNNVTILLNGCVTPVKPAVWRNGAFYFRNSLTSGPPDFSIGYGFATDKPLMCDGDGNGTKTLATFRNQGSLGGWYLRHSNTPGLSDIAFSFGAGSDTPICGDWNGDGTDTPGVVRGTNWYLRNSNSGGV